MKLVSSEPIMATRVKTCFVICPIGDEGSEVRKNADDLLELIVEPSLETFGFQIVRADLINAPSIITNDIIKYVQESELCIVDLTGHNPNVYYECGRRHENGKPTIQLISKGEKIPFDVAGIRTIPYELVNARSIRDTVITIRDFVKPFEAAGYVTSTSGSSLTSIAESLERIERLINRFVKGEIQNVHQDSTVDEGDALLLGPHKAIMDLLRAGNIDRAEQLAWKLRHRLPINHLLTAGTSMCMMGSKVGKDLMIEFAGSMSEEEETARVKLVCGSIVQYYIVNDMEKLGVKEIEPMLDELVQKFKKNSQILAGIYWQKSRLHHGFGDLLPGYEFAARAAELDSTEYGELFGQIEKPTSM